MSLAFMKIRRVFFSVTGRLLEALLAGAAIFGLGLSSSWYMVEAGSRLTTNRIGPWVTWTSAARLDADPYTRAHFASAGTLAVSADVQRMYVATVDSGGERLVSSCEYVIEGRLAKADWWSIVAFNQQGLLVANPAGRHAFTSQTVAPSPNGGFEISLAREARPGNWLPTRGLVRMSIVLTVIEPRSTDAAPSNEASALPEIRKIRCR